MSITRFKTVVTKKEHKCYSCGVAINSNTACTYGVTTDSDVVRKKNGIEYGYFCITCRDINWNDNKVKR